MRKAGQMEGIDELFAAVAVGDLARLRALITRDASLARGRNKATLSVLAFARYCGQPTILDALVAAGPPLDIFEAAFADDGRRVRDLAATDASAANVYSPDGFTALHFAAYFGATHAIEALLDVGASTEAVTKNFLTNMPLHAAAAGGRIEACRLLLERGANVNARQHGGYSALHTPCFVNNREMGELFLAHGADLEAKADDGKTPADVASEQGNMELAALLRAKATVPRS
jgi:ankyrin repeat protein